MRKSLSPATLTRILAAAVLLDAQPLLAQDSSQDTTINIGSTLVLVPAMVKKKSGEIVFTLTAEDFVATDDGVEQKLTLEQDTDAQPLALVIVVETGAAGARHLEEYRNLGTTIEAIAGSVPHRVAVVSFDSVPALKQDFSPELSDAADVLGSLIPGDGQAAILDGLGFAVDLLRKQPPTFRRAILLISETVDSGSRLKLGDSTLR